MRSILLLAVAAAALAALASNLLREDDRLPATGMGTFNPCLEPRRWHVADVDPRFDLSPAQLRAAVDAAVAVWEVPTGRTLFRHDSADGMPIRLVYDDRQAALEAELARRDRLLTLEQEIDRDARVHERRLASFGRELDRYNQAVERWNARGGGPERERQRLERESVAIRSRGEELDRASERIAERIDDFNAMAAEAASIGTLAAEAGSFEATIQTRGRRRTETRSRLTIYQFAGNDELVHTLAHELGHALGLDHVDDPAAIMHPEYRSGVTAPGTRNAPAGIRLADADIAALVRQCGAETWNAATP